MHLLMALLLLTQPPYETNPLQIVIGTGINLYQKIISPAQGEVCNFSPSCSHFAQEAIQKYGPLWGSLMAADRLMRCNPWAYKNFKTYYSDIKNYKFYDPVEDNFIFGKIKKTNEANHDE